MTTIEPSLSEGQSEAPEPGQRRTPPIGAWLPTWDLITTKNLEIRKRRGLMITMVVLIVVPTVLFYGLRLLFHAVDPHTYALAGSPGMFSGATNLMDEFGFIAAAALGAAAGTTDLSDGMFRHLVITGRSRLALYLADDPEGAVACLRDAVASGSCLAISHIGADFFPARRLWPRRRRCTRGPASRSGRGAGTRSSASSTVSNCSSLAWSPSTNGVRSPARLPPARRTSNGRRGP